MIHSLIQKIVHRYKQQLKMSDKRLRVFPPAMGIGSYLPMPKSALKPIGVLEKEGTPQPRTITQEPEQPKITAKTQKESHSEALDTIFPDTVSNFFARDQKFNQDANANGAKSYATRPQYTAPSLNRHSKPKEAPRKTMKQQPETPAMNTPRKPLMAKARAGETSFLRREAQQVGLAKPEPVASALEQKVLVEENACLSHLRDTSQRYSRQINQLVENYFQEELSI